MVKTLRFLLMSMLVMFGMSAYAEDIIWQEDFSTFTKDSVPTGGVYNYVCANGGTNTKIYTESLAGGTAPELLVAKNGGSFTATISLNGKSGKMILTYKANQSITVEEITQKDQMVSEATHVGNDYEREVNVPAGTTEIQLVFTNNLSSKNARLDNIKLYQGTSKKPAGLSWGKASTTLTIGKEITLTLSNENNLPVTYSSSKDSVATISQEGVITLKAAGKTVLTAAFAGNDEYEAQSVSVEVTVKAAEGGEGGEGGDSTVVNATCAEIIAGTDNTVYRVTGVCTEIQNTTYGNWMLKDSTGEVLIYGTLDAEGKTKNFSSLGIAVGDTVTVVGPRKLYKTTVELVNVTVEKIAKAGDNPTPVPGIELITVAQALDIIAALDSSAVTEKVYAIEGYVISLDEDFNPQYGNYTANIGDTKDATATIKVFRAKNAANQKFTEDVLSVSDKVLVQGKLQKYVDKYGTVIPETKDALIMEINGETTNSIKNVKADSRFQGAIYNLRGQRVMTPAKGLYIMNGKKFFVK